MRSLGSCFPGSAAQFLALGNSWLGDSSGRQVAGSTLHVVIPCRDRPAADATIAISNPNPGIFSLQSCGQMPSPSLKRGHCGWFVQRTVCTSPSPSLGWECAERAQTVQCILGWYFSTWLELFQRAQDTTRQWISPDPVSLTNLSLSEPVSSLAQGCLWCGLPGGLGASSSTLASEVQPKEVLSCSCRQPMAWQRQSVGHLDH